MENENNTDKKEVVSPVVLPKLVPTFDINSKIELMLGKKFEAKN